MQRRKRATDWVWERYRKLGLGEALRRSYDYVPACHELSFILRGAYSDLPKNLQALVFDDTLAAFRLLPEAQTSSRMSAANIVLHAAEMALPKQKRALAVSEFKHAVVAHKRRCKNLQDEGSVQLSQDVLVQIFSFLDMRSLVAVGLVCRGWNSAANESLLWQSQYSLLVGKINDCCQIKGQCSLSPSNKEDTVAAGYSWKEAFKRRFIGNSSWRFTSSRGYCGNCKSIIWLSSLTCANSHRCPKLESQPFKIRPITSHKVVEYLLVGETVSSSDDSSSDSDDNGYSPYVRRLPKLWAYPSI